MENYIKKTDEAIALLGGRRAKLLLQSCCGPCSTAVLERLAPHFLVTVYYCNPNIWPPAEYEKRLAEQERFLREAPFDPPVTMLPAPYAPEEFYDAARGLESEAEGGARCEQCFRLRLEQTAKAAAEGGYEWFTTTLTVSPHKNAPLINAIGFELAEKYGVKWLPSDFKKRDGYRRSIELSREYGLYRQDYCGCEFSVRKEN